MAGVDSLRLVCTAATATAPGTRQRQNSNGRCSAISSLFASVKKTNGSLYDIMTSNANDNTSTPPALLGPPRPMRITNGNGGLAAAPAASNSGRNGGGGGLFGALPGVWRGGGTAPPHHGTATAATIPTAAGDTTTGTDELVSN